MDKLRETIKKLLTSQRLLWLAVILLFFLYVSLASSTDSFKTRITSIDDTIYETTGTGNKLDQLENSIADIQDDVSSLKSATCKSISRLFELNGKFYSCVIGGL